MRPRISIRGSVRPSVCPSICPYVRPSVRYQLCKTAENRLKSPENIVVAYRSTMDASICPPGLVFHWPIFSFTSVFPFVPINFLHIVYSFIFPLQRCNHFSACYHLVFRSFPPLPSLINFSSFCTHSLTHQVFHMPIAQDISSNEF